MTMNHYGRNIATLHQYSTHIMWETRHCHVIVETFPATKRERGALRQRERRELTNGGGNGTGGRPVRTGSLGLFVRRQERPKECSEDWERLGQGNARSLEPGERLGQWERKGARPGASTGTTCHCNGNRTCTEN